jgi:hypothetical protein
MRKIMELRMFALWCNLCDIAGRKTLAKVFHAWQEGIATALRRGTVGRYGAPRP